MPKNNGGPAFPNHYDLTREDLMSPRIESQHWSGLSLRQWYVGQIQIENLKIEEIEFYEILLGRGYPKFNKNKETQIERIKFMAEINAFIRFTFADALIAFEENEK